MRDIYRKLLIRLFAEIKKKLKLTRIQPNQNLNRDGKLFTQTYIEITRLLSYKPGYERFERIIRLIELRITQAVDRRAENQPIDYQNIVKEYPSKNTRFTTKKGYIIFDNSYISAVLRRKVRSLR